MSSILNLRPRDFMPSSAIVDYYLLILLRRNFQAQLETFKNKYKVKDEIKDEEDDDEEGEEQDEPQPKRMRTLSWEIKTRVIDLTDDDS